MRGRFHIRAAVASDCALILTFIRELAAYERLLAEVVASEEDVRETLFGMPRRAEVVIGLEGETPVGFALFFHNYSTFHCRPGLYVEDLYVRESFRGRGYGRELLAHLAGLALTRGCRRMEWAVLNWNRDAIGFYDALGAVPMQDWTVFRLEGAPLGGLAGNGTES